MIGEPKIVVIADTPEEAMEIANEICKHFVIVGALPAYAVKHDETRWSALIVLPKNRDWRLTPAQNS